MSEETKRARFKTYVDLDDPDDVAVAMAEAETEEEREMLRASAESVPLGKAALRVMVKPLEVKAGDVNPVTGLPWDKDGVVLADTVICQWQTMAPPWAPEGSTERRRLAYLVPYLQVVLGSTLVANALEVMEARAQGGQDALSPWRGAMLKLSRVMREVVGPVESDVLQWVANLSGVMAEVAVLTGEEETN